MHLQWHERQARIDAERVERDRKRDLIARTDVEITHALFVVDGELYEYRRVV